MFHDWRKRRGESSSGHPGAFLQADTANRISQLCYIALSLSLSLSLTSLVALSVAVELVEKSVKPLLQDKKNNNIHNFNPESPGLSMPASSSYNKCVFQSYILTVIQTRADSVRKEVLDPTRSQVFHMTPMGEPEKLWGSTKQSQCRVKIVCCVQKHATRCVIVCMCQWLVYSFILSFYFI